MNPAKKLTAHSTIYILTSAASNLLPLALIPLLTNKLTPAEYGLIATFQMLLSFSNSIIGMNSHSYIQQLWLEEQKSTIRIYITNFFGVTIVVSFFIYIAGITTLVALTETPSSFNLYASILPMLAVCNMCNLYFSSVLRSEEKILLYFLTETGRSFLSFTLTVAAIYILQMTYDARVSAIAISITLFSAASLIYLHKKQLFGGEINRANIIRTFSLAAPLIPHAISSTVIAIGDRAILANFIDQEAVGIYTIALQFGLAFNLLTSSVAKSWQTFFLRAINSSSLDELKNIESYLKWYFLALPAIATPFYFLMENLILLTVDDRYHSATDYLAYIIVGGVIYGWYQSLFPYLIFSKQSKAIGKTTAIAATVNISLSLMLVMNIGILGVAFGTIAGYAIEFLITLIKAETVHRNRKQTLNNPEEPKTK